MDSVFGHASNHLFLIMQPHNCTTTLVPGVSWPALRIRLTRSQAAILRTVALYGPQQDADDAAVIMAISEHGPLNIGYLFRKRVTASRNRAQKAIDRLTSSTPPRLVWVQKKISPNGKTTHFYGLPS